MSSDGEINVAVKAEGVDDAAAEMGDGGGDGGGGGGGDGGGGSLSTALKGGLIGGLLSQALGPLLDVLDPILKVLEAFLAPIAALLLRLLAPVLRFFIRLLPGWIEFVSNVPGMIDNVISWIQSLPGRIWDFISSLPGMIWQAIVDGAGWLGDGIGSIAASIASAIWTRLQQGFGLVVGWLRNIVEAVNPDFLVEGENRGLSPDPETGFIDPQNVPVLRQAFEAGQRAGQTSGDADLSTIFEVRTDPQDYVVVSERDDSIETGG